MTQIQQSNFHIERCIYINGKQFDFMIEEFIINGCVFSVEVWTGNKLQ
jgi:hypothetical protein